MVNVYHHMLSHKSVQMIMVIIFFIERFNRNRINRTLCIYTINEMRKKSIKIRKILN